MEPSAHSEKPKTARLSDSWREWLKIGLPVLVLTVAAFAVAWHFVQPAPPTLVVIATGSHKGAYFDYAMKYAKYFEDKGVKLQVKETHGSVENYSLLTKPDNGVRQTAEHPPKEEDLRVDVAIVQSGSSDPPADPPPHVQAVAGVYYEPVWVFYRPDAFPDIKGSRVTQLSQLAGKKIAVGEQGSGTEQLAVKLLDEAGIARDPKNVINATNDDATKALGVGGGNGGVDAAFFVISPTAPVIGELFNRQGIRAMSFDQAHAYGRKYSFLSPITLYKGSIDIKNNLPDEDLQLIAPCATLVARDSTHEAIIQLLVEAAKQTHAGGTLLSDPGTFPTLDRTELPVNKSAREFLTSKPSILSRMFPFWLASLIERLWIMVLPLLAVLLPLVRMMPPLYKWKIRRRIYMWYKQVRKIDESLSEKSPAADIEARRNELVKIEKELLAVQVPLSYMEELYNLRLHVGYVRSRLDSWLTGVQPAGSQPQAANSMP